MRVFTQSWSIELHSIQTDLGVTDPGLADVHDWLSLAVSQGRPALLVRGLSLAVSQGIPAMLVHWLSLAVSQGRPAMMVHWLSLAI